MRYIILILFLSGCAKPETGDIYENLLTGERIEIERTSTCDYKDIKQTGTMLYASDSTSSELYILYNMMDAARKLESTERTCVYFNHKRSSIDILPANELKKRWKKLN